MTTKRIFSAIIKYDCAGKEYNFPLNITTTFDPRSFDFTYSVLHRLYVLDFNYNVFELTRQNVFQLHFIRRQTKAIPTDGYQQFQFEVFMQCSN